MSLTKFNLRPDMQFKSTIAPKKIEAFMKRFPPTKHQGPDGFSI